MAFPPRPTTDQPPVPRVIPTVRPAVPPTDTPQPAQPAAPAAPAGRFAWVRGLFGRSQAQPRPGQPDTHPAAIPATVYLTVTVQSGPEGHRIPVKDAEVTVNDREPVKSGDHGTATFQGLQTGGKSISVGVSHSGYIGVRRTIRPASANVTETIVLAPRPKINMIWVLAAVALIALVPVLVGMFTSAPSAPSAPIAIQPPPMPEIKPLDLASAAWIGPVQGMLLFLGTVLIGMALLDRWLVKQLHDVTVPLACVLALYFINWAPIRAALATPPFSFTDSRTIGWLVIVASIVAVYAVSKLPTPDYTASALYFALLVVAGMTIGSIGLMQVAFGVPEAPVVSMGQTINLIQHKAWEAVKYSLLVYALCVSAVALYGWESVKPNEKGGKPAWGGPVMAIIGLVVYYATSRAAIRAGFISDTNWTWLYYAIALLITLMVNWIAASVAKEVLTGEVVQASHSYTDVRLGFLTVRTPWDVIGLEIMMGIFLILMFGTI